MRRHTFATTLIRGGTGLVTVADMLGHARLDTVRTYTNTHRRRPHQSPHPAATRPLTSTDGPITRIWSLPVLGLATRGEDRNASAASATVTVLPRIAVTVVLVRCPAMPPPPCRW